MEQKSKLVRLDQMTQESLRERPYDSIHAIGEYFKNLHERNDGDIEYLTISENEIKRVLSYKITLPKVEIEINGEDFHTYFNSLNPIEREEALNALNNDDKEEVLSGLLDAQLQTIVLCEDVSEIESLFSKTLISLNKKVLVLAKKIANPKIKEQFRTAITQTSLMVFIAAFKSTQPQEVVEFDKFIREFLFYSKDDDKDIYKMRLFYLNEINAEYLDIGYVPEEETSPAEAELIAKEVLRSRTEYDSLIKTLKDKYSASKLHLA